MSAINPAGSSAFQPVQAKQAAKAASASVKSFGLSAGRAQQTYNVNPEDFIMPGMNITGKDRSEYSEIIEVSDEVRQKIFEDKKADLIRNMGNVDGEGKSAIYEEYQLSIPAGDRLKATYTIGEYESAYADAMLSAIRAADPAWEPGKPFDAAVLDAVSWDSVSLSSGRGLDALA